jgi:imidazolonepropionase
MLLIHNISQLVTMRGPARARGGEEMSHPETVLSAAILIDGEKVLDLGPQERICASPEAQNAQTIDAGGRAVLPGFCDSHTHPVFAKERVDEYELKIRGATYEEIASKGGGILHSARTLRETPDEILLETALRHAELFLAHGTTVIEAKSGYGLDVESELRILRVIRKMGEQSPLETVPTFLGAHQVPLEYKNDRDAYVRLVCERMIPAVVDEGLAVFCDVFCDKSAFTVDESRRILEAGARHGLAPKIHADQLSNSGGTMLGIELGAITADHLEQIGDGETEGLAGSNTIATLLPGSVFHLGLQKYAPARTLINKGACVAIATDFNPGSSPTVNMQMILSMACNRMRMTPAEALCAATVNGAAAMKREMDFGQIAPGRQADLFIATVADYRLIPYYFGMNHCRTVIKKGKVV